MKRAALIKDELGQIETVEDLTGVFESIASMHIAKIRGRVVASKSFFAELWQVYSSLRIDPSKRIGARKHAQQGSSVAVIITSEGKFGGGLNDKILQVMLDSYPEDARPAIVAMGSYGAAKLKRQGVPIKRAFSLPPRDIDINVSAVIRELQHYERIAVFYQTYDSLRVQKVARIDLLSTVREYGQGVGESRETLSPDDYIFEPGIAEIADYMESVMMGIALTRVVMEAKLAGYAARYNTMSLAKKRAGDLVGDFRHEYHRAKRAESDERIKEVLKAAKYQRQLRGMR